MNLKPLVGTSALLAGGLLAGCGGDSTPAAAMRPQALDTMHVLAIARSASETSDPLPVADGALQLADTEDETSDPAPVI